MIAAGKLSVKHIYERQIHVNPTAVRTVYKQLVRIASNCYKANKVTL